MDRSGASEARLLLTKIAFAVTLLSVLSAPAAHAGLIGSTVNVGYYFADQQSEYCNLGDRVVGESVEYFDICAGLTHSRIQLDIADDYLEVTLVGLAFSAVDFNGYFLTPVGGPSVVDAYYAGGTMGITSLLMDNGGLWINLAGQSPGPKGSSPFNSYTARVGLVTSSVPEPGTVSLLAAGLVGLLRFHRRNRTAR